MFFKEYYDKYWEKRTSTDSDDLKPVRDSIPLFLRRFSQYGTVLNQLPEGTQLLDIGCGNGNISALFLNRKCRVTGLDISTLALEKAKRRGIITVSWDLNNYPLPFDNDSFEVITIIDVLEHVVDPVNLLKESRRILRKGGMLLISIPNFARWDNRMRMLFGNPKDLLHWPDDDGVEHLHWFTKKKIRLFLKKAGFSGIRFIPTGLPFGFVFGILGLHGLARILAVRCLK
jgi:methionine biosynthesis protein MetW